MNARNRDAAAEQPGADPHIAPPEGEYAYAPLAEIGVCREDVNRFWQSNRKHDLRLPYSGNFSNCVYCFLKGARALAQITADREKVERKLPQKLRAQPDTPADINWWNKIERKYGRDLTGEKRKILNDKTAGDKPFIGFWGINGRLSYQRLADAQKQPAALSRISADDSPLPCDCTD